MQVLRAFKRTVQREERRQHPRIPVTGQVSFRIDECIIRGELLDISMGGLFLNTDTGRLVHTVFAKRAATDDEPRIRLAFSPVNALQIKATGHIVRMNRLGIGVAFTSAAEGTGHSTDGNIHLLTETVDKKEEKALTRVPFSGERRDSARSAKTIRKTEARRSMPVMPDSQTKQDLEAGRSHGGDEVLKAAIIGTWVLTDHPLGRGETTYFIDGRATAHVYGTAPELSSLEAHIKGSWEISDGELITKVLETDPPGVLPPGHTSTCRIESVNVDELVLMTPDQTRLTERRRESLRPAKESVEELELKIIE